MAIQDRFKNARVFKLVKVERRGIGGAVSDETPRFTELPVAGDVNACYQPIDELKLNSFAHLTDSRDSVLLGSIFMDDTQPGTTTPLIIDEGDLISFVDELGRQHDDIEIARAFHNSFPTARGNHWDLFLLGRAEGGG